MLYCVAPCEQCCAAPREQCCDALREQCCAAASEQDCAALREQCYSAPHEQCCTASREQCCAASSEQCCAAPCEQCCAALIKMFSHKNNVVLTALFKHQYCHTHNLLTRLSNNDNNSEPACSIDIAFSCSNNPEQPLLLRQC